MHFLRLIILIGISISARAQDTTALAQHNGFKSIKLGTPIDSVKGASFKKDIKEKNQFPTKLYVVDNPEYKNIGEVKVKKLELKTYKDLIYEINVTTEKDTRLMKGMVKTFGEPKYIIPSDSYNWLAHNLSLTFKNHSKKEILLTYRSYPMLKMMLVDKGKKVDDIADDF
ncbi:MAG: hypothetical protein JJE09_04815 [Bacteroidia bacterium]|nr:hypothetical protein [Bacteroidia bacterium]